MPRRTAHSLWNWDGRIETVRSPITCFGFENFMTDVSSDSSRDDSEVALHTINLLADARQMMNAVNCFDFVPSDYETVWKVLSEIRSRFPASSRPSFCEWGSGLGVVTGMAEILGFQASGIEIDATLAEQSRELLAKHDLSAAIMTGSYLDKPASADVTFVYCWPGKMAEMQRHFFETASNSALLLICHGASDVRCVDRQCLIDDESDRA